MSDRASPESNSIVITKQVDNERCSVDVPLIFEREKTNSVQEASNLSTRDNKFHIIWIMCEKLHLKNIYAQTN